MENVNEKFMKEYDYSNNEKNSSNGENNEKRFVVDDLSKADWCFKKIMQLEEEKNKLNEYVETEKSKYDDFLKKETERIDSAITHFKLLIQMFVDTELEKNPKFKLKTLNGSASYGKEQTKIEFNDEEMLKYCQENNLNNFIDIKQTVKLNKKEFKEFLHITDDNTVVTKEGEILGNITVNTFKNFNVKVQKNN